MPAGCGPVTRCGWLGVRLDTDPDRAEIAEIVTDAHRQVAPARLVARLP